MLLNFATENVLFLNLGILDIQTITLRHHPKLFPYGISGKEEPIECLTFSSVYPI